MPELPEVETARRGISPHVVDRRIRRIVIRERRLRWPVPDDLGSRASGRLIKGVDRRAKYLFLETGDDAVMIHLGMSGSLRIVTTADQPGPHDHVDFILDDATVLRYRDPRRFGSIHWIEGERSTHPLLAHLGPEPLSDAFCGPRLFNLSRRRKTAVKNFIMDSRVVVGVGNIYASEALFLAGIRPSRAAGRVSAERYDNLSTAIKKTLARAIRDGGTTLRDFVGADGSAGYFKQRLSVYGREGELCNKCQVTPIQQQRLGQRASFFCHRCQR